MTPPINARVIAQGRYLGRLAETVRVQNEHGYAHACRVEYTQGLALCHGWFLLRDLETWKGAA